MSFLSGALAEGGRELRICKSECCLVRINDCVSCSNTNIRPWCIPRSITFDAKRKKRMEADRRAPRADFRPNADVGEVYYWDRSAGEYVDRSDD